MTLFGYRVGIQAFTLLGFSARLIFIFGVDPETLGWGGLALFFLALWVAASGFFSLFLLALYRRAIGETSTLYFVGSVLRQGILLGCLVLTLALLSYFSLLAWWSSALSLVFFLLIEFTARKVFGTS